MNKLLQNLVKTTLPNKNISLIFIPGQQDDARMNLSVVLSAIRKGAKCVNHVEVVNLIFDQGKTYMRQ